MFRHFLSLAGVVGTAGVLVWAGCTSDDGGGTQLAKSDGGVEDAAVDASVVVDAAKEAAPFVGKAITYGNCPTFAKCGGAVAGSWTLSGGCLSEDTFKTAKASCAGLQESNVVIKANGSVVLTATTMTRTTTVNVTGKLLVPKSCLPIPQCAFLGSALTSGLVTPGLKFDSATCTDSGTSCTCDIGTTTSEDSTDDYTTSGDGTLTTDHDGGARTYDYCVEGSSLKFTETTSSQSLKMFIETTKQ